MGAIDDLISGGSTVATPTTQTSGGSAIDNLLSGNQAPQNSQPQKFANPNVPTNKVASLPQFLGGGTYNINNQNNNLVNNTGHNTYGGEPSVKGFQRDDIMPVALGGSNQSKSNIQMQPADVAAKSDAIEKQYISAYKSGSMTLAQARSGVITDKYNLAHPQPSQDTWHNFISSIFSPSTYSGNNVKSALGIPEKTNGQTFKVGENLNPQDAQNAKAQMIREQMLGSQPTPQTPSNMDISGGVAGAARGLPRAIASLAMGNSGKTLQPVTMDNISRFILGDEPLKSVPQQAVDTENSLNQAGIKGKTATGLSVVGAAANTVLNLLPLLAPTELGAKTVVDNLATNSEKVILSPEQLQSIASRSLDHLTPEQQAVGERFQQVARQSAEQGKSLTLDARTSPTSITGKIAKALGGENKAPFATLSEGGSPIKTPDSVQNTSTTSAIDKLTGNTEKYANPQVSKNLALVADQRRSIVTSKPIIPAELKTMSASVASLNQSKNSLANNPIGTKPGAIDRAKAEIQSGNTPPVKVRTLEDGTKFIEDGRHHLEAASQLGIKNYPVEDVTSHYQMPETPKDTSMTPKLPAAPVKTAPETAITPKVDTSPLTQEAQKYKSADEFVKAIKANPEKIPTTPEYQKYTKEQDAFVKQEKSLYAQMKAMRDTYSGKTIKDVTPSEIDKYDNLQKELNKTLSQKTLSKSPEAVIKTHIGDKALESQLTDIWNKANKPELPTTPKDTSMTLNSGFNPGVDKFIAEDVKPAAQASVNAAKSVKGFVQKVGDSITNVFDRGASVQRTLGDKAYSDAIKAIHTPDAEAVTYDNNFGEAQKYFDKFSDSDLKNFNLTRGEASSDEAKALQATAKENLHPELKDPKINAAIKQASDYVLKLANDNGLNIKEFKDYFHGVYKSEPSKINSFLDNWFSTDKYTKEKVFPTPADAAAYGLELKHQNPITNIKAELQAVAKRVGLVHLKQNVENSEFATTQEKATPEQKKNWIAIPDPVFKNMLFHPSYAKLVRNLISTNKVSQSFGLKSLRQTARIFSTIKFYGSIFHQTNMLKAAISDAKGGAINPKGLVDFGKGFKSIDTKTPQYKEYVNLGGGHQYSLESEAQTQLHQGIDRLMRGNYLGGLVRGGLSIATEMGGYNHWLFDKFIPSIKFNSYQYKLGQLESKGLVTDAQKIGIIKENQNIYGEMNERLFGRSGTATSVMRLLFTAPGYGEGNFRMIGNVAAGKGWQGKAKAASFIFKSLLTTLIAATIATRIATGKWPQKPKTRNQVRDLFKIQTNAKDGNGDQIMVDLMSYDKDYWSVYGNAGTLQPGKIGTDLTNRVSGLFSTPAKIITDMASVLQGKTLVDYKNAPIFSKTDTVQQKFSKFWANEIGATAPISSGTFSQSKQKGNTNIVSIAQALTGFRPTTSEQVKEVKAARADYFSMQTDKKNKQVELNTLYKTNPQEAVKQAKEFNKLQMDKVKNILKLTGKDQTSISNKDWGSIGIINLNPKSKDTSQGTTVQSFLSP